jgi:hypothetical protein
MHVLRPSHPGGGDGGEGGQQHDLRRRGADGLADPATLVSKAKRSGRSYSLLEELNTRPRTTYLADARAEPEKEGGGV